MKKKILALCLVVVLAVTAVTGATLAYFTDTDEVKNTFSMGKVDIKLDETNIEKPDGDRVQANDYTGTNMVPGHVFTKDPTIHVLKGSEDSYIFLDVTINKFNSLAWVMAKNDNSNVAPYMNNGKFSTMLFVDALLNNKELRERVANAWFNGIEHANWAIKDVVLNGDYATVRLAFQGDGDATPNTVNAKEITDKSIDIRFMESFQMPATVTQEMIDAGVTEGKMAHTFNTAAENFHMNFKAYAIQADTLADVDAAYEALFDSEPRF